jgi:hypothetical protein
MKQFLVLVCMLFLLIAWKADKKGPWITTEGKRIVLQTRPAGYSGTASPDSLTIQKIIAEQEQAIDFINKQLKTGFDAKVEIFLYNLDEAKEKIGTNGGGFASLDKAKPQIYFTFRDVPIFNTISNTCQYVGIHEMVHIITIQKLGRLTTSFFGEGYSNALDGNCGTFMQNDRLTWCRNDSTLKRIIRAGKLASPADLLYNDKIPVREYYPQVGVLVKWLFETYGVEKINQLYAVKTNNIENAFFKVTGDAFKQMSDQYLKYLKSF